MNLFVPLPFGLLAFYDGGWIGMLAALFAIWACGLAVCGWSRRLGRVFIRGARAIAFFQFVPVLHVGSLVLTIFAFEILNRTAPIVRMYPDDIGVFASILMIAMPLLFFAFVFGGGHRLILGLDVPDDESEVEAPVD